MSSLPLPSLVALYCSNCTPPWWQTAESHENLDRCKCSRVQLIRNCFYNLNCISQWVSNFSKWLYYCNDLLTLHSDKMDGQEPFMPLAYCTKYSMSSSRAICRQQRTLRLSRKLWQESWKKSKSSPLLILQLWQATRCRLNEWTGHSDVRLLLL